MTHISPVAIVAVCLGGLSALLANLISFTMIDKINELSPEEKRISYFWWGTEVRKRFKQLYPKNRLTFALDSCMALMLVSFVLIVRYWVFG